jgi:CRISPR-associated protein Csx17
LEAAVILDGDLSPRYPSLLGSGGNDGNLDFTDNFRQRFLDLFDIAAQDAPPRANTAALLDHALHGAAVVGTGAHSIGQYMPGAAGGANSSSGLAGRANVNPWDFVLFMEGTVLFSAAASRRLGIEGSSSVSAPFAIRANAIGHASVSPREKSSRGEQWLPLWERPATLREIRALLSEGRAQLGRSIARDPVDMARAIARLGVARGITAFERYGYIERNGQSTFAVPLGRWKVASQPHQDLLSDLDNYLRRLSREAGNERATASLSDVARRVNDAVQMARLPAHGSVFLPRSLPRTRWPRCCRLRGTSSESSPGSAPAGSRRRMMALRSSGSLRLSRHRSAFDVTFCL